MSGYNDFLWDDSEDDMVIDIERLPHAVQVAVEESKKELTREAGMIAEALHLVGKNPNAIPPGTPNQHAERRPVRIGSHPVGGMLLARIIEVMGTALFGPGSSDSTFDSKGPPDPTYHWGVIVGDYYHELNTDRNFVNLYQNGKFKGNESDWKVWDIGYTTFNDEAIRLAGEDVIARMAHINPKYDLLNNNCQLMAINILTQICEGAVPQAQLYTSWKMLHLEDPASLKDSLLAKAAVDIMLKNTPTAQKKK